jgi:hypothetical protein
VARRPRGDRSMRASPCGRSPRAIQVRRAPDAAEARPQRILGAGTSTNASTSHRGSSDSRMLQIAGAAVSSPASSSRRAVPGCQSRPMRECGLRSSGPTMTSSSPTAALGPGSRRTDIVMHDEIDGELASGGIHTTHRVRAEGIAARRRQRTPSVVPVTGMLRLTEVGVSPRHRPGAGRS